MCILGRELGQIFKCFPNKHIIVCNIRVNVFIVCWLQESIIQSARCGFMLPQTIQNEAYVVAILDERAGIGGKYHDAALAALPTCPTTETIEDVQQFIREQKRPDYFL